MKSAQSGGGPGRVADPQPHSADPNPGAQRDDGANGPRSWLIATLIATFGSSAAAGLVVPWAPAAVVAFTVAAIVCLMMALRKKIFRVGWLTSVVASFTIVSVLVTVVAAVSVVVFPEQYREYVQCTKSASDSADVTRCRDELERSLGR